MRRRLGDCRMLDGRHAVAEADGREADLVEVRVESQLLGPLNESEELGRHGVGDPGAGGAGAPLPAFPKSVLRLTAKCVVAMPCKPARNRNQPSGGTRPTIQANAVRKSSAIAPAMTAFVVG